MKADTLMRQLLDENRVGHPHQIRLQSLNPQFLPSTQPAHWRQRREISGNQVLTFGIYVEVLQRWFGPITSVSAHGGILHPVRDGYRVGNPRLPSRAHHLRQRTRRRTDIQRSGRARTRRLAGSLWGPRNNRLRFHRRNRPHGDHGSAVTSIRPIARYNEAELDGGTRFHCRRALSLSPPPQTGLRGRTRVYAGRGGGSRIIATRPQVWLLIVTAGYGQHARNIGSLPVQLMFTQPDALERHPCPFPQLAL